MRRSLIALLVLALVAWPSVADAKPMAIGSGAAEIDFDIEFGLKLVQFGVTPGPIAPATQDGLVVTLPVRRGGHVRRDGSRASIDTAGGVSQAGETFEILLERLRFNVRGRTGRLSAVTSINGLRTDRFTFARGRATSARRTARGYRLRGLALTLNEVGAETLNSQLKTDQFTDGEKLGVASIDARR